MEPPFLPGQIVEPPYFIDREEELEKLTRLLGTLAENQLVLGQRRMGKSSLIHNLRKSVKAQHPDVGVILIDCREVASIPEFCDALLEGILGEYQDIHAVQGWLAIKKNLFQQTIREAIQRVQSVGVKSLEDLFTAYIDFREQAVNEVELLRRSFQFAESFATEKRLKLVIVFDEFQELGNFGDAVFQVMKSQGERSRRVRFVYSGSAVRLLENIFLKPDSPLYLTAGKTYLGPLPSDVVAKFVKSRFKVVGMSITDRAAASVCTLTGGIPYYVQKLGTILYLKALHRGTAEISEPDVAAAHKDMVHELSSEYEARFEFKYGVNQKKVLMALARKSPLRRIDIARAIGKRTEAISGDLSELESWMEIEKIEQGVYRLSDPVFGAWLAPKRVVQSDLPSYEPRDG